MVPLTSFASHFRTCFSEIGISHVDRFRGQFFRRGAASSTFSRGVPGDLIQLYGNWFSDSKKLYSKFSLES